jgi:acyl-CoA hydrolase
MENFTIVRPEYLNHFGNLFGGVLLQWVDEFAWIAAARDFPGNSFVTVAMSEVRFRKSVKNGSILRFDISLAKKGKTAVHYNADVYAALPEDVAENCVFSTQISFVKIDSEGNKCEI